MKKMNLTDFVTETNRKKSKNAGENLSLFVKLGICAAACAFVMLVKYADMNNNTTASDLAVTAKYGAVSALAKTDIEETENDEYGEMGKLQFVELPGILEVFAPSGKFELPIEAEKAENDGENEDDVLTLKSEKEQYIKASEDCTVKVCENNSVILSFKGDYEVTYGGKIDISVEEGQSLKKGDTIGKIAADEVLTLKTDLSGRPINPKEVFEAD